MSEIPATLKAARAVGGCDFFMERLRVLCIIEAKPFSERLAYMVAYSLAGDIVVDEDMTVATVGVTDNKLKSALNTQYAKLEQEQAVTEP